MLIWTGFTKAVTWHTSYSYVGFGLLNRKLFVTLRVWFLRFHVEIGKVV